MCWYRRKTPEPENVEEDEELMMYEEEEGEC